MTHARLQRQLSAYLDGELAPADADQVRSHLAQCPVCREELARLEQVKSLLQRLPERSVPHDLWATVQLRIREPVSPRATALRDWWRGIFRRPVLAASAAVLIVALVAVPLVRGHIDRLRAAELGPELYIREHAVASSADPFSDRAYLGLLIGDANLALAGAPREEGREER